MKLQKTFKGDYLLVELMAHQDNPTFVKWAGGKTQLLEQFAKLYPQRFNRYFEAFLGSGAVRDKVDELIPLLREHRVKDNSREY